MGDCPDCGVDGRGEMNLLGTGFFIADGGYIATAAHVIEESTSYKEAAILQLGPHHGEFRNILIYNNHDRADVGVAMLGPPHGNWEECLHHPVLSTMSLPPEEREF